MATNSAAIPTARFHKNPPGCSVCTPGLLFSYEFSKNHVIAKSSSHWRGNPPDIQIFSILNQQLLRSTGGFPHQSAIYYGMIATGNHHYFNSLRGAPLVRNDTVSFIRSSSMGERWLEEPDGVARAVNPTASPQRYLRFSSWNRSKDIRSFRQIPGRRQFPPPPPGKRRKW